MKEILFRAKQKVKTIIDPSTVCQLILAVITYMKLRLSETFSTILSY